MENTQERILSIAILPDYDKKVPNERFNLNNIINVSNSIISGRIYVTYSDYKTYSCFVYILKKEEICVNDYFLCNQKLEKAISVGNEYIEVREEIGDNEITHLLPKSKCKKVIGSSFYKIKNELRVKVDYSFLNNMILNYNKKKQFPLRCKIGIGKDKINNKTILIYVNTINNDNILQLFYNISTQCYENNKKYELELLVNIWKKRLLGKGLEIKEFQCLYEKNKIILEHFVNKLKET